MKTKTTFYCTECGNEYPKWQGQCQACGSWNTVVEAPAADTTVKTRGKSNISVGADSERRLPKLLSELSGSEELRFSTGLGELDRVLGGGAVQGSLVLVGGAPGIGKSTLLLQICGVLSEKHKVLYVSGEESERQLKLRAERLRASGGNIHVLAETDMRSVLAAAAQLLPEILIADSVQTLYNPELSSAPGSVSQVKDSTMSLLELSKQRGVTVFLVSHVNKEGAIAGPKVLEHMVDCVLYFEGEGQAGYRILHAAKNRFGSTNEIGVFEMSEFGLEEVPNPSERMLEGRPLATPGTCVTCVIEGTRPLLAEIQALAAPSSYNVPRRNSIGIDYGRAMMLLAVLEKRGGLRVSGSDVYINVIGGLSIDEPGADLATVLAIASGYRDIPLSDKLVAIGEVGLTGELRPVAQMSQRLSEIARLGFETCVIPRQIKNKLPAPPGLRLIEVKNIVESIKILLQS